jgi:hypothetical protein
MDENYLSTAPPPAERATGATVPTKSTLGVEVMLGLSTVSSRRPFGPVGSLVEKELNPTNATSPTQGTGTAASSLLNVHGFISRRSRGNCYLNDDCRGNYDATHDTRFGEDTRGAGDQEGIIMDVPDDTDKEGDASRTSTTRMSMVAEFLFWTIGLFSLFMAVAPYTSEETRGGGRRGRAYSTTRWCKIMVLLIAVLEVGGRTLEEVNVSDMDGFFNTVSNYATTNIGSSIMNNGDTAVVAVGVYECAGGTCASSSRMLYMGDLSGEVKCVEDDASCVIDGENERRVMNVRGTGGLTLTIRAFTIQKGEISVGGGISVLDGALVDIELCTFSNCRATSASLGGGAMYVSGSETNVNVIGTSYTGNVADSGNGDDIYRNDGAITVSDSCPSPYQDNTAIQGELSMIVAPIRC